MKESVFIETELEPITMAKACKGKYPCLTYSNTHASFWVVPEDGGTDVMLSIWSDFPYPYPDGSTDDFNFHAIDFEVQQCGLEDLLGIERYQDEFAVINWLLERGIAPGQPFRLDAEMIYDKTYCWDYNCYEYDSELLWEIIEILPETIYDLSPEESWQKWADELPGRPLLSV